MVETNQMNPVQSTRSPEDTGETGSVTTKTKAATFTGSGRTIAPHKSVLSSYANRVSPSSYGTSIRTGSSPQRSYVQPPLPQHQTQQLSQLPSLQLTSPQHRALNQQQQQQQRVWVQQCAVDTVKFSKRGTFHPSPYSQAKATDTGTVPVPTSRIASSSPSFKSSPWSLRQTPKQQPHGVLTSPSIVNPNSHSSLHQQFSQSFSSSSTTVPADLTDFSSSSDDISSSTTSNYQHVATASNSTGTGTLGANNNNYTPSTVAVSSVASFAVGTPTAATTTLSSDTQTAQRVMEWGWKEGILLEQGTEYLSIQLLDESSDPSSFLYRNHSPAPTTNCATQNRLGAKQNAPTNVTPPLPPLTVQMPLSSLEQGTVVLANDVDPVTLEPPAPPDLISLTHLHEPAVCVALCHRYERDVIYTNTGPVLLALNPFAVIPGLYGDAVQKKYVEAAEKMQLSQLPPHVYAIADTAFRSMMRALEDTLNVSNASEGVDTSSSAMMVANSTTESVKSRLSVLDSTMSGSAIEGAPMRASSSSTLSLSRHCVNQSILVSGESGSGKTVTTKFVMKYLAALSQRSVQIQESAQQRAYVKAQEEKTVSTTWRQKPKGSSSTTSASTAGNNSTVLAGSSIEAQVLQSNPILESFGNARTARNDNSSRFGKFIEIQFTASGKLVGANMQTYLLEKVRLHRQSPGERNYHIFYEFLSGGMTARELSHFFLAPTAGPEDFNLTNAVGTVTTRRDGISDRETYADLIAALTTMKFAKTDIQDLFSITAAILHASNLTFTELQNEMCCLDESNIHLDPVCTLLGLSVSDLNQALCHCLLTAGGTTVTRSLTAGQAVNGLEALLKETYGAMFQYLVQRINGQISADKGSDPTVACTKGVATIGVLDIFGFESFAVNSFEQLCINYCNEALQQQFNAFVLENEQAEYEREGIQWSFIEFPENQDVLDLIEKRGSSILSILDDQCRAPGSSDKAFCLAVYGQCGKLPRFETNRKQEAMLQFSIHHYAGPVEYTATGFTAKNKDELPKETILLLSGSEIPLVRELASIMEGSTGSSFNDATSSEPLLRPTPRKQLHRSDSSVGRPTVGGQFRTQLRMLRLKIDRTAPHYIRCLKPNDLLVPDNFDAAIVAEQLKCGGILEAVRVARAGFTQHYTHADFCRRYRTLAWKEMAATTATCGKSSAPSPQWGSSSFKTSVTSNRHSYPLPRNGAHQAGKSKQVALVNLELDPAEAKVLCKDLIKVLYRKIQQQGVDFTTNGGGTGPDRVSLDPPSPHVKAKAYTFTTSSSTPSWSKGAGSGVAPSPTSSSIQTNNRSTAIAAGQSSPKWKRGSAALTSADLARVGIQLGKTKVFLRHKAFEVLERVRSIEQSKAATQLNSIFRRYLARIAYIPYRDAFRQAKRRQRQMMVNNDEFKETKEQEIDDSFSLSGQSVNRSFQSARTFHSGGAGANFNMDASFHDKWTEMQIKDAIHNPVPRHEWGKKVDQDEAKFLWVIREGMWVKNYGPVTHSDSLS